MRLWHQSLITQLPAPQLLGQHRECCALRGNAWAKKHSVVDYVFTHEPELLVAYHHTVMHEMIRRGYQIESLWWDCCYRGKNCLPLPEFSQTVYQDALIRPFVYEEHDTGYYKECILNLKAKGVALD